MAAAEAELWSRGYATSVLWVLEQNEAARAFYRRIGYLEDGGQKTEAFAGVRLVELRLSKATPSRP